VGEAALFVDFHGAEHAEIDVAATNHGEGVGAGEIGGAGDFADRLFAGVDQVGIFGAFEGIRANAEHAVLALQDDIHASGNVVGNQRGHADAEVDVEPILQFAGDALDDAVALFGVFGGFGFSRHRILW